MKFKDIKPFPNIHYHVDVPLEYVEQKINEEITELNLQINPDFQRGHVWTEEQQISYMEFLLKNPQSGKEIYFNHPNWMNSFKGDFVLVDGLQRLTAVLAFLNNKIKVYGSYYTDYEDRLPMICLSFNVACLKTRADVLRWYLDFNSGGTPHSQKK